MTRRCAGRQANGREAFGKFSVVRERVWSERLPVMRLPQVALERLRQVIEPRAPLPVSVLYDEPFARDQALRVCASLVDRFEGALHIDGRGWRFSQLRQLSIATAAAQAAAAAAVTFIATVTDEPLPLPVRNWFALWREHRAEGAAALVALIGTPEDTPRPASPVEAFLAEVAREAGVDLIVGSYPVPRQVHAALPPSMPRLTSAMRRLVQSNPPVLHWGIND